VEIYGREDKENSVTFFNRQIFRSIHKIADPVWEQEFAFKLRAQT